jgi:hypothetical protein
LKLSLFSLLWFLLSASNELTSPFFFIKHYDHRAILHER